MAEHEAPVRWRFWLGWSLASLVVLLFVSHVLWTSVLATRMSRKIEALRRAGEPILPMDFAVANVNAPDNAAPDILAAGNLINPKDPAWDAFQRLADLNLPLRDDERRILVSATEAIAPALQRLEAARGKTRFAWDIDFTQPTVGFHFFGLTEIRQLANALSAQAILDHDRQLDRAALSRIEQIFDVSRLPDHHPSLVGHLVSGGVDSLGALWLLRITPDLQIGSGPNDASPQDVRRLIGRLLDETMAKEGLMRSFRSERMFEVDMIKSIINGVPMANTVGVPGSSNPAARYFIRPLYYRAGVHAIDNMNAMLLAAQEPSLPAANAKFPVYQPSSSPLDMITNMLTPSLNQVIQSHYRGLTERQFAAVALAVRWYAVEHNGALPQTLQELVPTYLPAVPIDRFSLELNPLGYKPIADAPIVYSVGQNGKDDGGSEAARNPNPRRAGLPVHEWEMLDRVRPLYRRPRPAPGTNPAEDPGSQ